MAALNILIQLLVMEPRLVVAEILHVGRWTAMKELLLFTNFCF
jgi:hypothetical protein